MTFFSGFPYSLEKDLKPSVEGRGNTLYRGCGTPLDKGLKKYFLMDITIIKSTKSYIVGHFFKFLIGKFLKPFRKGFRNLGFNSLCRGNVRGKPFPKGSDTFKIFTV